MKSYTHFQLIVMGVLMFATLGTAFGAGGQGDLQVCEEDVCSEEGIPAQTRTFSGLDIVCSQVTGLCEEAIVWDTENIPDSVEVTDMVEIANPPAPEFSPVMMLILAVAIISIIAISAKTRLGVSPRY